MIDLNINIGIGLPREMDGVLYHAKVKRHAVDRYWIPVGVETSKPITDTRLFHLEVLTANAEKTFLTASCREKVWKRVGTELGIRESKVPIIKQALYGLKYSGAAICAFLAKH